MEGNLSYWFFFFVTGLAGKQGPIPPKGVPLTVDAPTAAVPEFWRTGILCLMQPALLYLLKTAENDLHAHEKSLFLYLPLH